MYITVVLHQLLSVLKCAYLLGKCVQNNRCVTLLHLSALDSVPIHILDEEDYHLVHGFDEIVCDASPPSHASDVFSFGRVICAVSTYLQCHFLCTLGKKCILSDSKLRPQLSDIIDELEVPLKLHIK